MTERRAMEPFEAQFADRVRAYTNVATDRRIDALGVARTAMSSQRATGWSVGRLGAGLLGRRSAGVRWATAIVAVVLIGVVAITVQRRPFDTAGGPVPDVLRHSWQRPLPVAPGPDLWGSGFLSLAGGQLEYGREPGAGASRAAIAARGADTLVVTATAETIACAVGDVGAYRWAVEGKGTVMTLTTIDTDACAAREKAIAGAWVRSDLPPPAGPEATLPPGTHETSSFDPFGDPAVSGQLSYTVPDGWKIKEDQPASFMLHHLPESLQGQPSIDSFILLLARPAIAADFNKGAACGGPVSDAPGVGGGLDDLVAAIRARPGVVSTTPAAVTIGGYQGETLDLELATSWTGGCLTPDGPVVGMPLVHEAGSETGPGVGLGPDHPLRLILLDLTDGRTMAVAIFEIEPSQSSVFEAHVAEVMPIVESFEFHPPTP
jgi:hypothetical protein